MKAPASLRVPALLSILLLAGGVVEAAELRTWTDATGKFRIEAELISAEDGIVLLRTKDEKMVKVAIDRLSAEDKKFLNSKPDESNPFVEVADAPKLTPQIVAVLRKKLRGKFSYDAKTGSVTLQYDWSSKNQLSDFEPVRGTPALTGDGLVLPGGAALRHVVDFDEVTTMAPVFVRIMKGTLLRTSGGVVADLDGLNPDTIYLAEGPDKKHLVVPEAQRKGVQWVRLVATAAHLEFDYGERTKPHRLTLSRTNFHAGSVELCGGDEGYQFGALVLTGRVNGKWVSEFTAAKR